MKRFVAVYLVISILMTHVLYGLMSGGMVYAGSLESAGHNPFIGRQSEVFGHLASTAGLAENQAVATTAPSLRINLDASLTATTGPGLKINLETFRPTITSAKANPDSTVSLEWPVYEGYEFTEIEINEEIFGTTAGASFNHKQVLPSQSYEYRIRASYDGVYTSWSDVVTVITPEPLAAPGLLDYVTTGPSLMLTWQFPEDMASDVRYDVFSGDDLLGSTSEQRYVLPDSAGDYLVKIRALVNGTYFTQFSSPLIIGDVTVENYAVSQANKDVYKAGLDYAMYLDEQGHVWTWGNNENRQLGIGYGKNDVPASDIPVRVKNLNNIVKIYAGYQTGFAIDNNGTLYGWGANSKNQLGLNSPWNMSTPATMPLLGSSVKAIDSGQHHTAVLMTDGKVYTFGNNSYGQLGDGTTTSAAIPKLMSPAIVNAVSVHCGRYSTYVLTSDGTVYAFGRNNKGQLGLGHTNTVKQPTLIPGLTGVAALNVRAEHVLARTTTGQLYVFGRNNEFQLGLGDNAYHTSPTLNTNITDIKAMDTTYTNSLFIRNNGDVLSTGKNTNHQLGVGDAASRTMPQKILTLPTADALGALYNAGSVILEDDSVYLWGNQSQYKEFGLYGPADLATPTNIGKRNFNNTAYVHAVNIANEKADYDGTETISLTTDYASRVYNEQLTMVITIDGKNAVTKTLTGYKSGLIQRSIDAVSLSGLSAGTHTILVTVTGSKSGSATLNKPITIASKIASFNRPSYASGKDFILYLDDRGDVWAFGNNVYGQLGSGKDGASLPKSDVPVKVKGLSNIASVHAGNQTAFAVGEDGKLYGWGHNALGQLGLGNDVTNKATPVILALDGANIVAIDSGHGHTVALMKDGRIYTFGDNRYGQLGDGSTSNRRVPTLLSTAVTSPVSVQCGDNATYVLTTTGAVYSFGQNTYGQLGHGTTTDVKNPTLIPSLTNIRALDTMSNHVLAVDTSGAVYAFGDNRYAQLGLGNRTSRNIPTKLIGLSAVHRVRAGDKNTLIELTDGNIITAGDNSYYQLGTGNNTATVTKQTITTVTDITQLLITEDTMALVKKDGGYLVWGDDNRHHTFAKPSTHTHKTPTDIGPRTFDSIPYLQVAITNSKSSYKSTETILLNADFASRFDGESLTYKVLVNGEEKFSKNYATPLAGVLNTLASTIPLSGLKTGAHELKVTVQGNSGNIKTQTFNIVVQGIPIQKSGNFAAGLSYGLHLSESGYVWAWGDNENRQLGVGKSPSELSSTQVPVRVNDLENIQRIFAGYSTAFAIDINGKLYGWGANSKNQLGLNAPWNRSTPALMSLNGQQVVTIDSGQNHTAALMTDGSVYTFGDNNYGQLGDGTATDASVPQKLTPTIPKALSVHCGRYSTYVLTTEGKVYSFGRNNRGQLGLGHTRNVNTPTLIPGLTDIVRLNVRAEHVVAVDGTGKLYVFGRNSEHQLGLGHSNYVTLPIHNDKLTGISHMDTTYTNTYVAKNNGDVLSMGGNTNHELGIGHNNGVTQPQKILTLTGIEGFNAIYNSSAVLTNTGNYYLWGDQTIYNEFGLYNRALITTPEDVGPRTFDNKAYIDSTIIVDKKASYAEGDQIQIKSDYAIVMTNDDLTQTITIDGIQVASTKLPTSKIGIITSHSKALTLSGLSNGKHTIRVTYDGTVSEPVTVDLTVIIAALAPPNNLRATANPLSADVAFDAVDGATDYEIEFDKKVVKTSALKHSFNYLVPETAYTVRVRAIAGNVTTGSITSEWSLPLTVTTTGMSNALIAENFEQALKWTITGNVALDKTLPKANEQKVLLKGRGGVTMPISTASRRNIRVQAKIGATGLNAPEESLVLQWFDGSTWYNIHTISWTEDDGQLKQIDTSLPKAGNLGGFRLRILISGNTDDAVGYLDDVVVLGEPFSSTDLLTLVPGQKVLVAVHADRITQSGSVDFILKYDSSYLSLTDYSAQMPGKNVGTGPIGETNVDVVTHTPSNIRLRVHTGDFSSGYWQRTLTILEFKGLRSGKTRFIFGIE